MTSTKPYLLRAIFEWAEDNGFTPQVLVDANTDGVLVPINHIVDGQIVLNIGTSAIQLHTMDNDCLSFSARFSGVEENIYLPIESILAIFARENSQGIFFEDLIDKNKDSKEKSLSVISDETNEEKLSSDNSVNTKKKSSKTKQSHLKIIK